MNADMKPRGFPLWTKLLLTGYLAVLVPFYWKEYGPTNFLYFCDVAILMSLVAIWTERSLWASMPAVGILIPQAVWCIDFTIGLFGGQWLKMTDYMFDEEISLFARGLSFFHFWLPFLLVWMVWRLGYDRRAFAAWSVLAIALLLICWLLMPAPPAPFDNKNLPVNINYVYGLDDKQAQTWMHPTAWFALLVVGLPLIVYLPTHLALRWAFPKPHGRGDAAPDVPAPSLPLAA
ncbi:MAG: hypothetical protein K2X38_00855 [Gemmataceae bacterium]|nr:hypothetical protein [Gemmataceae bacterium]